MPTSISNLILFTDGSVNPKSNIGYGAYLALPENELTLHAHSHIKVQKFEHTSSTKLELQTLLWALNDIKASATEQIGSLSIQTAKIS